MHKQFTRICVIGSLLVHAGSALALEKLDYVQLQTSGININDGKVFIKPVNGNYGQATTTTTSYHVKMKAGCKGQNMLKTSFVAFGNENVGGSVIEASNNYRKTVNANLEKILPWTEATMNVPLGKLGFNPAAMCQQQLDAKLAQGVSRQQVLASDFVINRQVTLTAVAGCGKLGKNNDNSGSAKLNSPLKITCKGGSVAGINNIQLQTPKPPKPGGAFQATMQVTRLDFKATPYQLNSACPARAKFTGSITVDAPGSVSYRVLFPGSAKSATRTLKFSQAGTRSIGVAEFETNHSLPVASATLEILSPVSKKAFAHFKVNCIAPIGSPGGIQSMPGQNAAAGSRSINKLPAVQLGSQKPAPATTLKRQDAEPPSRALILPAIQK